MKLSLWILAEWMKEYEPEATIHEKGLQIETVRLLSAGMPVSEHCVYIGRMKDLFMSGKEQVICIHKNDLLILKTDDLDEILNQVLNAFDFYNSWNGRIMEAVSSGNRPAQILKIANEVIKEPLYMLDAHQFTMALSEGYGLGEVNELWDHMLESGTTPLSFLTRLDDEYPQHRTQRGLYYFNAPFVEKHSYNYNMFSGSQWVGLCSLVECGNPIPQNTVDLFHAFCLAIENWFLTISREKESMMIDSMFREALISEEGESEAFSRQYMLRFRHPEAEKYIMVINTTLEQPYLMGHVCRELNLLFPDLLAVLYQESICIILNCHHKTKEQFLAALEPVLKSNHSYGGCSLAFFDLRQTHVHFTEALYAAEHAPAVSGSVTDFADLTLQYALDQVFFHMRGNPAHPEVTRLAEYDKAHHTDFSRTLRVYLEQERSQARTARELNLHRNTLTYRLQRIGQLLEADLENKDTRLHLLLSFRFQGQPGGKF